MPSIAVPTRQPSNRRSGLLPKKTIYKAAAYTLVADDSGAMVILSAAAVLTLPAKVAGLWFMGLMLADAAWSFASAGSADDIIAKHDAGADSVAFSTANEKIGSSGIIECIDTDGAGTLKWVFRNTSDCTVTVA